MKKYSENQIIVPRFNEANGFYTTRQRSKLMGKIHSLDTKPEIKLKKALWNLGLRYRKNLKRLYGCPDIVFTKYKLAIFVDGEFWHGYKWEEKKAKLKSNRNFWIPKIERNMQRDVEINRSLINEGWVVMRFWEHDLLKNFGGCVDKITNFLNSCTEVHEGLTE